MTTAVFGAARSAAGFEFTDLPPPAAPPPLECPPPEDPPPPYDSWRARVFDNFEWRRVRGHAVWHNDWEAGGAADSPPRPHPASIACGRYGPALERTFGVDLH